jgi:hypothetical protein
VAYLPVELVVVAASVAGGAVGRQQAAISQGHRNPGSGAALAGWLWAMGTLTWPGAEHTALKYCVPLQCAPGAALTSRRPGRWRSGRCWWRHRRCPSAPPAGGSHHIPCCSTCIQRRADGMPLRTGRPWQAAGNAGRAAGSNPGGADLRCSRRLFSLARAAGLQLGKSSDPPGRSCCCSCRTPGGARGEGCNPWVGTAGGKGITGLGVRRPLATPAARRLGALQAPQPRLKEARLMHSPAKTTGCNICTRRLFGCEQERGTKALSQRWHADTQLADICSSLVKDHRALTSSRWGRARSARPGRSARRTAQRRRPAVPGSLSMVRLGLAP